jgi:hypothetical protein
MRVCAEDLHGVVLLEELGDLLEAAEGEADEEDTQYLGIFWKCQH